MDEIALLPIKSSWKLLKAASLTGNFNIPSLSSSRNLPLGPLEIVTIDITQPFFPEVVPLFGIHENINVNAIFYIHNVKKN